MSRESRRGGAARKFAADVGRSDAACGGGDGEQQAEAVLLHSTKASSTASRKRGGGPAVARTARSAANSRERQFATLFMTFCTGLFSGVRCTGAPLRATRRPRPALLDAVDDAFVD